MASLREDYTISHEWEGTRYLGLTIDWDYGKGKVHISMPGYVEQALVRLKHQRPRKPQHQPYPHVPPKYGAKNQFAKQEDESPLLDKSGKKVVQEVCGTLLYYSQAVDCTMLAALGSITTHQ